MYRKIPVPKPTEKDKAEFLLEMGLAAYGGPGALQKYLKEKEQKEKAKTEEKKKER